MRITLTITTLNKGGAEKQLAMLAIRLRDQGDAVSVIALAGGGWYADYLTKHHIPVTILNLRNRDIPREMLPRPFLRLVAAIRRQRPDVVIGYLYRTTIWTSLAARFAGVPVVIASRRDAGTDRKDVPLSRWLERLSYLATTHFIANSEAGKRPMVDDEGIASERIEVIYNGIDPPPSCVADNTLRQQLGNKPEQVIVGMLANFAANKNQQMLVRAAHEVVQECPEVQFVLAGADQGYQKEVEAEIAHWGLQNHFHLLGPVGDPSELLAMLDIGVLCGYKKEGISNSILEYMAYAKPVVATRVGGNPELVIDGKTGYLVELEDVDALAAALVELASDAQKRQTMGEAGRARVEAEFSWDICVQRHLTLFDALVKR
jgi:glycosyltransferase involved in cell wall biosynthesis